MKNKVVAIENTELQLFKLGFGTVDAGTKTTDEQLALCINCYREHGGNVIDTARVYGEGKSEEALGRYFKAQANRDDFVLVTKGGHPPLTDLHQSRLSVKEVEADLDASLAALGTDHIDLYFLHRDDESQEIGNLIEMLESFVKKGKIRYYGCSNYSALRMQQADEYARNHNYRGFVANEMFYNIASDKMNPFPDDTLGVMDKEMLAYHKSNPQNLAMPYFSICSGFFHKLLKDPHNASLKQSPYYTEGNLQVFEQVKALMSKYNASLSQILLGFYTACNFNSVPLFGTSKVANLEDALAYLDIDFDAKDFDFK